MQNWQGCLKDVHINWYIHFTLSCDFRTSYLAPYLLVSAVFTEKQAVAQVVQEYGLQRFSTAFIWAYHWNLTGSELPISAHSQQMIFSFQIFWPKLCCISHLSQATYMSHSAYPSCFGKTTFTYKGPQHANFSKSPFKI
jgi:hypothetical protein